MAASCDAPAKTIVENPMAAAPPRPWSTGAAPATRPNGHDADEHRRHGERAGTELAAHYLRNLDVVLSASTLPPVWQVGQ